MKKEATYYLELVNDIGGIDTLGVYKKDSIAVIQSFVQALEDRLLKGERVKLGEIGTLGTVGIKARNFRNIHTGAVARSKARRKLVITEAIGMKRKLSQTPEGNI